MLKSQFLLVAFGRIATALIAVASLRIMTTFLEPNDYGQWALLVACQTFGTLFLINPVDQHIFRHTHEWWDDGTLLKRLGQYNRYVGLVSSSIAIVVMLWWIYTQANGNGILIFGVGAGLAVGLIVYLATWNIGLTYLLNMLGFRGQSVFWMTCSALVGLICSSFLVMHYPNAIAWILGQLLGSAVGALGAWRTLRNHSAKYNVTPRHITFSDFVNRPTILKFCLPLAAATGLMWLQNSGYRFVVGSVWGVAELGILVLGLGVATQLAGIVESLAMQFLYPYYARRIADAKSDRQTSAALSDLMNVLAPIYAIWAGFNAIFASVLLFVLADARYHIAVPFVIFGAMLEFLRCTTNLWSNTARAIRRTSGLIHPYGFGALVVWLGATGAAYFELGLLGLSFALVAAGIATCGSMIVLMQRLLRISIDLPRMLFGLGFMAICFAMAIITPVKIEGLNQNLILLLLGGGVVAFLIAATIWKNPALARLLSTPLRSA